MLHAALTAALLAATPCNPSTSEIWERLGTPVEVGQDVEIETTSGGKLTGILRRVDAESVVVDHRKSLRRVPLNSIRRVGVYHDDTTNGMLIAGSIGGAGGALMGFALGGVIALLSGDFGPAAAGAGVGLLAGGTLGVTLGWAGGQTHSGYRKVYDHVVASVSFANLGGCDEARGQRESPPTPWLSATMLPARRLPRAVIRNSDCKTDDHAHLAPTLPAARWPPGR